MKARIKWAQGAMFIGESGSGHAVVMDGPEEHGGRNLGGASYGNVITRNGRLYRI